MASCSPVKHVSPKALFQRATLLVGGAALERFAAQRVIIFGLGGVGSWCAEALARTGFGHLTLVDSDLICVTNVNRQAQATAYNVGAVKADELRSRLREINPQADIVAVRSTFDQQTCGQFDLARYDYVVDAIDSLSNKVLLLEQCVRSGVTFYSSMGAAARLDPAQIRTGRLDQTRNCHLARAVRAGLRKRQVPLEAVTCVYSLEPPIEPVEDSPCGAGACLCLPVEPASAAEFPDWCASKAQINGALVHVTAIFGFTLAGLVVRHALSAVSARPKRAASAARPEPDSGKHKLPPGVSS
jgi:tRNA threonylcarbamoyladenosine dehydratase